MLSGIRVAAAVVNAWLLLGWLRASSHMRERSQGNAFVEYGLLIAVVALIALTAGRALGFQLRDTLVAVTCFLGPSNSGCSGFGS